MSSAIGQRLGVGRLLHRAGVVLADDRLGVDALERRAALACRRSRTGPSCRRASSSLAFLRAARTMLVLNAPARPRSPVATTIRWVSSLPVPASSLGLCGPGVTRLARLATTVGHALRIGPAGLGVRLGTAKLRRGDHVHRLGDLLGRLHRADPKLEGLEAGHPASGPYANCLPNAVSASFSLAAVSSSSALVSRIVFRMSLCSERRIAQHRRFVAGDVLGLDRVDEARGAREDRRDLLLDRHRLVLRPA